MRKRYKIGFTAGVFDLLHKGHLNILKRAKEYCETLVVAITTDDLCKERKGCYPAIRFKDRCDQVLKTGYADIVVAQRNMDKVSLCLSLNVNAVFVGDDWKGTDAWISLERQLSACSVDVIYLTRTPGISSSELRQQCKGMYLRFDDERDGYTLLKYDGTDDVINVPNRLGVYPILQIDSQAFSFCKAKEICCGDWIEKIGNEAFWSCTNLESIILPEKLQSLGKAAFANCVNLKNVHLPDGVITLPSYLFMGCCSLKNIMFSQNIERICPNVFDVDSPCVDNISGVYVVNNWAIGAAKSCTTVRIPQGCIGIADASFLGNSDIEVIYIPESVRKIGAFCFDGSKLWDNSQSAGIVYADQWAVGLVDNSLSAHSLTLRNGTTGIGDMAFACCRNLHEIKGLELVRYIGINAFRGCVRLEVVKC